jgi:hypothetical protein
VAVHLIPTVVAVVALVILPTGLHLVPVIKAVVAAWVAQLVVPVPVAVVAV